LSRSEIAGWCLPGALTLAIVLAGSGSTESNALRATTTGTDPMFPIAH
jgi:hypothetical protein